MSWAGQPGIDGCRSDPNLTGAKMDDANSGVAEFMLRLAALVLLSALWRRILLSLRLLGVDTGRRHFSMTRR
jgi:hypothetical protein